MMPERLEYLKLKAKVKSTIENAQFKLRVR